MITASIVTYNTNPEELLRVVHCALNSSINTLYIVDNSPSSVLKEVIDTLSSKIVYIYGQGNVGYGKGNNIAIRKAIEEGADYHVILNPDIYFDGRIIEFLHKSMEVDPDVGLTMPQIVYPDGEIQYLCKLLPTPLDLIGRRFLPGFFTKKRNYNFELRSSGYNKIMEVPYLSGCFMFLRTATLAESGLFDENFFMYCEDIDFSRRINRVSKTIFNPDVSVVHTHKKGSYHNFNLLFTHIKSAIYYFNKWGWFFDRERKKINKKILEQIKINKI